MHHIFLTLQNKVLNQLEPEKKQEIFKVQNEPKKLEENEINWDNVAKGIEEQAQELNKAVKEKTETIK